eukprot:scaffold4957_cov390-Prasinococcus_capsulatus_cf.AAC.2
MYRAASTRAFWCPFWMPWSLHPRRTIASSSPFTHLHHRPRNRARATVVRLPSHAAGFLCPIPADRSFSTVAQVARVRLCAGVMTSAPTRVTAASTPVSHAACFPRSCQIPWACARTA